MKAMILHPIGYEERPRGHEPDHFQAIEGALRNAGHEIVTADRADEINVLLFDNGEWDTGGGRISPYDQRVLSSALSRRVPVIWFDSFDRAPVGAASWTWRTMHKDEPDGDGHRFAADLIAREHPVLYFMRKMDKRCEYPRWVLPLEYPLFVDLPLDSKESFLSRPFDVCGIANLSYPRAHAFIGLLRALGGRADCEVRPHYRRLDHFEFVARHRAARFFVEADASLGSERPMVLSTVSAMLRITSPHRIPFERQDLVHQVEIGDHDGWIRDEDIAKLRRVLADGDLCYSIYVQGAEFMRKHYSLEARTRYVIDNITKWIAEGPK